MLTPEQLQERMGYLGGSDAAAALGLSPWVSPYALWAEKTGKIDGAVKDSLRLRMGTFCEPAIVDEYWRKTGNKVLVDAGTFTHDEHDFMRANLDGLTWQPHETPGNDMHTVWEAKTVGEIAFTRGWGNGIPPHYRVQLQHYMACTGATESILCALVGLGQLRIYEYPRSDQFIDNKLIPGLTEFWERVQTGNPPPADGHETTGRAIREQLGSASKPQEMETGDEMAAQIWDAYTKAAEEEKAAKESASEAKNVFLASMLDTNAIQLPDGRIVKRVRAGKTGWRLKELPSE